MNTLRPTVHGYVHGIVDVDPITVQCDGCGATSTEGITRCGIEFRLGSDLRLCRNCRKKAAS